MKMQARIGDMSSGHWIGAFYFPPVPLTEGSPDTFACGLPASRVGDSAAPHIAFIGGVVPFPPFKHTPKALTGSATTFINGRPAFRAGDKYDCGDIQLGGCPQVLVGDADL